MLRCAQSSRTNSCLCDVFVLVWISRSRFTITVHARLASEIFLNSLQKRFSVQMEYDSINAVQMEYDSINA